MCSPRFSIRGRISCCGEADYRSQGMRSERKCFSSRFFFGESEDVGENGDRCREGECVCVYGATGGKDEKRDDEPDLKVTRDHHHHIFPLTLIFL